MMIQFKKYRIMLDSKEQSTSLEAIVNQICKEGLCHRPALILATWEAAKKVIMANSHQNKCTLLANCFLAWARREPSKCWYALQPTENTFKECGLISQVSDKVEWEKLGVVNEVNLYQQLAGPQKEYFKSDKDLLLRFFYLLITKLKDIIKAANITVCLQNFGTISIEQRCYNFEPVIFAEKIVSPHLKYKRMVKQNTQEKSEESKLTVRFVDSINQHRSASQLRKRPYFHQLVVDNQPSNTKICNDLLGAGIDPLTYNVSFSKLTNSTSQLLSRQFTKPEPSQARYPCVIDKFSRTKGSQLTSVKVGNSIIVRIGSNYSPAVKNYYLDITTKSIQHVVPEAKIKLDSTKTRAVQPATESQEYFFVLGKKSKQLESRVQLRRELYKRYCQYYQHFIPNDCVAPLDRASIERIIGQVKALVKKLGKKDGSPLINSLMAQANQDYYFAYKKAVLDYILKDKDEMVRTGINLTFKTVAQWGKPLKRQLVCHYPQNSLKESKRLLELNHMIYPQCLNKIYVENEKINIVQIFKKRKEGQYRPYSILYYIKRNINQLNEAFNMLCEGWVKKISNVIEEHINLKQESYTKLKQFFNSIHIIMSNKLKQLVYGAISDLLQQFSAFQTHPTQQKNLLIINITQNGQMISFIDDIQKVFRFQLLQIVDKIIETTRKVPRVQSYLKLSNQLYVWGVEQNDNFILQTKKALSTIVEQNYVRIDRLKVELKRLQKIFGMIQRVATWCREQLKIQELQEIFKEISSYQREISEIKCYYMENMVVVDCIELKKKLYLHLKSLKKLIFDSVDERLKQKNSAVLSKIKTSIKLICREVKTTGELVDLYQSIQQIKLTDMPEIKAAIEQNLRDTMQMFKIDGFTANLEVMRSTYLSRHSFEDLTLQIYKNEKRLYEQRLDLQKKLREKLNSFQAESLSCLKQITSKIDTFDMRKLYSEYLAVLTEYKQKVEANKQTQKMLNLQEEDLKWTASTFPHAKDLENIVEPNYQLWKIVAEYDACIKEWKYIELSHFDIDNAEARMTTMDEKITKLISKLKNFAGLKIIYDLQNDVKQFIAQQVSIIKIFSNPGLKERHWSLFNKRLPLSGYDLKQLTYGRIKLLYQYEKNLKVLMSISNQAAKQFEIENEKQQMHDYWNSLTFELYHISDENIIFIDQEFLDQQIQLIDQHLTKTVILKNSPFSKALVTMLAEWENWLVNGKKILIGFRSSQDKFMIVRNIFKMDEINKLLPIQSTQYDSIENIWKSVIKKILDQPKVTEFFKSQKMPDIIEEIGRKADFIKSSFNSYLTLKRMEFTRLYFLPQTTILHIISLLSTDNIPKALQTIGQLCFVGIRQMSRIDSSSLLLKSTCDQMQIKCESLHSKKGKSKFFEELVVLERNMRDNISMQIKMLDLQRQNFSKNIQSYTLTSLFAYLQIQFSNSLRQKLSMPKIAQKFEGLKEIILRRLQIQPCVKYEYILSKILFMLQRCQELKMEDRIDIDSVMQFQLSSEGLQLKLLHQAMKYNYEYVGDEVPAFMALSSDRLMWQLAYALSQHVAVATGCQDFIRQIGLYSGQYVIEIANPINTLQNNFDSCIMGIITTNYWVLFNDYFLRLSCEMLAKLTHLYQMKKEKIDSGSNSLAIKNNELTINSQTMVYLNLSPERVRSLPQGILTCTRSISLTPSPVSKLKEYLNKYEKQASLKQYLHMLKHQFSSINIGQVLKTIQQNNNFEESVQIVRVTIWKQISLQKQQEFTSLFSERIEHREDLQCKTVAAYINLKVQQIKHGLKCSDIVFVVGQQSCKSRIIELFFKGKPSQLFNDNRGLNFSFIEQGVSEMDYKAYLEKAREKSLKDSQDVYLYIDSDLCREQFNAIELFNHVHKLSPQHSAPLKFFIEIRSLSQLDPASIIHSCVIYVQNQNWSDYFSFKLWVNQLKIPSPDKAAVLQLQHSFNNLLNFVVKMQKRPYNDNKSTLAKRFYSFYQLFLDNLNGKQAQRMCQLQKQGYIFNSFIYCAFWALGVCSLRNIQVETLKKYINETFIERLDLPGQLDEIYLAEDNEWTYWQTLRQQFVGERENMPFYQIWVPTAINTKLLTVLVRLVEKNHSILLCGSNSGRSSLLNQISCFELSYNPFFIDCHKHTSTYHIANLTRGKVLFGQSKKNLILVDDLHLPSTQACGILRTFIERGYCPNSYSSGKLNQFISKPSVIATWKSNEDENRCFSRLFGKMIPVQIQKFQEKDLEYIFKTYINCFIPSTESGLVIFKAQSNILNFFIHTMKAFPGISPKQMRLLIQSICKADPNKGQRYLLEHMLIEVDAIISRILPSHQAGHFFRHMCHYYSKFLEIQVKNHNELKELSNNYLYDIRQRKEGQKKQTIEDRTEWMQQIISTKGQNFHISNHHTKVLQRLFWGLKGNHAHVIILSNRRNGSKSIAKMAGWLLNLSSTDYTKQPVSKLLQEVVKVLKTGGKVDQCVNILSHQVICQQSDMLKLVHSLMFSPQFHECFGQILMEQIIKSFNSEKKFLKKNVKKAELIKKIREKFNSIYHFCLCISQKEYQQLLQDYPKFDALRVVEISQWPSEAFYAVSKRFITEKQDKVMSILTKIEDKIRYSWQFLGKSPSTNLFSILATYQKVMKLLEKKASITDNSEMWSKRVKMNQEKLESLQSEKKIYEAQHTEQFQKLSKISESIIQANKQLERLRQKQAQLKQEFQQLTSECTVLKMQLQHCEQTIHQQYEVFIETHRQQLINQSTDYLNNPNFESITMAYEFQIDKKSSQIIQLLYLLEQDCFNRLKGMDYSELGTMAKLISSFKGKMEEQFKKQERLSSKFTALAEKQNEVKQYSSQIAEAEDKVSDLKDDQSNLKEAKDPASKRYEETVKKIQQYEAITNILLKYEYVLRSKNDSVCAIPSDLTGHAVLATYLITYCPLLQEHQVSQFESMLVSKLAENQIKICPEELRSFFSQEQQFQMTYKSQAQTDEWINLLALQSSDLSLAAVGQTEAICGWISESFKDRRCVWLKRSQELKEMLQQDHLIYIYKPDKRILSKISYLISSPIYLTNNFRTLKIEDEQLTIHENCKVIYIYNSISEVPNELRYSDIFTIQVYNHQRTQLSLALENRLRADKIVSNRQELVHKILKGFEEMSAIDDKMHSIITKMRKENVVSEIIFKRIEEEGEHKLSTSRQIEHQKKQLSTISTALQAYQNFLLDVNKIYPLLQKAVPFSTFLSVFSSLLEHTDIRHLSKVTNQLQLSFSIILDQNSLARPQSKVKFNKLIGRLLKSGIVMLQVPDLSIGLQWMRRLLDQEGLSLNRFHADSATINEIKQRQVNVAIASRKQEVDMLVKLYEQNEQRLKNTAILILALDYIVIHPMLQAIAKSLNIRNGNLLIEDQLQDHQTFNLQAKQSQYMNKSLYQRVMDKRWLAEVKHRQIGQSQSNGQMQLSQWLEFKLM